MPYHIGAKGSHDCSGYPVVNSDTGRVMGCHKTKDQAKKQLAALYIHVEDAKEKSTMAEQANVYAQIVKYDDNGDGTLTVYGKATDSAVDIDQQICDPNWLDTAMPDWFKTGGNIREQHSNIAAGVATEYEKKADGHYIETLVVDPVSVKKVKHNVLKGFSIGIKSPRVVRDQKAANGRIIDGQIVEISLVDRPANPNAKIILAKSVDGEPNLVKVEEPHMATAKQLVEELKKFAPADTVKFDRAAYDKVRQALAQLIVSEAKEMEEGEEESTSFAILFQAIMALEAWYEHEEAEGEVEEMEEKAADDAICPDCGETEKMCKCEKVEKELVDGNGNEEESADAEKSVNKCLECGCHQPADSHGREDVTTVEMITEKSTITPIKPIEEIGIATEDESTETENSNVDSLDKTLLANSQFNAIIEKAVKSAMVPVLEDVTELKSAKEAAENKVTQLEEELATAKSLAIGGGPKRTTIGTGTNKPNEARAMANLYLAKAASTTDNLLADGYRLKAKEFLAEANETSN